MGINPQHFKDFIVKPTLIDMQSYNRKINSKSAQNLLLGTAAVESGMGHYLRQLKGPARGPYQPEEATGYQDLWVNYILHRPKLITHLEKRFGPHNRADYIKVIGNFYYATWICRLDYFREQEALPASEDVEGLAYYWKKYYNSKEGKGTVEHFIIKYEKFKIGELK